MNEVKTCFVISPIGDPNSSTRKRSDIVFNHIIYPAVTDYGYSVTRADKLSSPSLITVDIMRWIRDADLVIADLTDHNPNVFYELAIRHMVQKPVISLIKSDQAIPFDVAQNRTILFDEKDLDSVEQCRDEIRKQIQAVSTYTYKLVNPISIAFDLAEEHNIELSKVKTAIQQNETANKEDIPQLIQKWHLPINYNIYDILISPEGKALEREFAKTVGLDVMLWIIGEDITHASEEPIATFEMNIQEEFSNVGLEVIYDFSWEFFINNKITETSDLIVVILLSNEIKILEKMLHMKPWLCRKMYLLLPENDRLSRFPYDSIRKYFFHEQIFHYNLSAPSTSESIWTSEGRLYNRLMNILYAVLLTIARRG